jgi:hypothetical protein
MPPEITKHLVFRGLGPKPLFVPESARPTHIETTCLTVLFFSSNSTYNRSHIFEFSERCDGRDLHIYTGRKFNKNLKKNVAFAIQIQ